METKNKQEFDYDYNIDGKKLRVGQIFCATPILKATFSEGLNYLRNYDKYEWENISQEDIEKHELELLDIFTKLTLTDLRIIYYLRNIREIYLIKLLKKLEERYAIQLDVLKELELIEDSKDYTAIRRLPKGE